MPTSPAERTLDEKLAAIANHFGLGHVRSFERAPGTNENYIVDTTKGDYLFKIIVNTTLEDMLRGLPFLQRLQAYHFEATAYYLQAPDGSMCYSRPDCDAVVMRRLLGAMPKLSEAVNREVGMHLARLHLVPCDGLPEKRHWLDARYLPEGLEAAVSKYGPERLRETLAVFHSLQDFRPATFPQSIMHGDLDTTNCLFDGNRLVAFVDWQEIGVSAALMDFAMTMLGFCFVDAPDGSGYWAIFDPGLYRSLFEGYTSVRPFSPYELAHLDAALKYVGLTQPVWSMLAWDQYHPGQRMIETNLLYWKFGLHELTLPTL
ncbi:MAG TPA: phosphotransferase [Ktedonobacteraceae bacterium]|nr:phosphotransferase [Ktedonobacteraceae bacterium]